MRTVFSRKWRGSVVDETTSHPTKAASCQVAGYPAKVGIQPRVVRQTYRHPREGGDPVI